MELVGRAGGGSVLRNTGGRSQGRITPQMQHSRFRQCRLESREGRLPLRGEPLETVTYVTKPKENLGLRRSTLFHGLYRLGGCGGTGIGALETGQNLVSGVLQPRVGLVQLASRLARQLAELVAIGHVRKCPKNQIRTHYLHFSFKKWLPGRNYLSPPVQLATTANPVADCFNPVVIDARNAGPVQNL